MKQNSSKIIFLTSILVALSHSNLTNAQAPSPISGPFGSKPIQLSFGSNGITRKEGGYVCTLDAMNGHYSEWGETEKDSRILVLKTCNQKSGLLLCNKDKVACKEDK